MSNDLSPMEALIQVIEEYQKARTDHDRLLSYSTDYEVSSDVMQRSATELEERSNALQNAVKHFRKAPKRLTVAVAAEDLETLRRNSARYEALSDLATLQDPYDRGAKYSSWNWTIELETGCTGGLAPPADAPTFEALVDVVVAERKQTS